MTNSADPDQLASSEANWYGVTLFAKTRHVVFVKRRVKKRTFPNKPLREKTYLLTWAPNENSNYPSSAQSDQSLRCRENDRLIETLLGTHVNLAIGFTKINTDSLILETLLVVIYYGRSVHLSDASVQMSFPSNLRSVHVGTRSWLFRSIPELKANRYAPFWICVYYEREDFAPLSSQGPVVQN